MPRARPSVICIGAGPAGLTAALLLAREGADVTVLEADPRYVGGISRTVEHEGFRFDIGGHRFFSKSDEVEAFWQDILGADLIERPRKSRILYGGKLYDYPLRAVDALSKLGIAEAVRCMLSYGRAALGPVRSPRSFEDWVVNRFGRRLFEIFFRTYTEKVWGMPCSEISADWAAQRIKGLSLFTAILRAVLPQKGDMPRARAVKTLIGSFRYPRLGPGMMWEAVRDRVVVAGGRVAMDMRATGLVRGPSGWTVEVRGPQGEMRRYEAAHVVCSAPMREVVAALHPPVSPAVALAAASLRYRDFITVALVVRDRHTFDDNWIYVHEPSVRVGRVQNFKSWSPEMVPDSSLNCLGLEYFCHEGDGLWSMPDEDLVDLARTEIGAIGLAVPQDVLSGTVIRQPKAYPVYDEGYAGRVDLIRTAVETGYPGLHLVGRNGMHRYNNQDHAMVTAMIVARNILAGEHLKDPWCVNGDAEYHEEDKAGSAGWDPVPRAAARPTRSAS